MRWSNSKAGSGGSAAGVGAIAVLAAAVWGFSGFYTIGEAERGVVLRFGKFYEMVDPGLNWKPTFVDEVKPVNVQTQRVERSNLTEQVTARGITEAVSDVTFSAEIPGRISFVEEIPRTGIGKPRIAVLREALSLESVS